MRGLRDTLGQPRAFTSHAPLIVLSADVTSFRWTAVNDPLSSKASREHAKERARFHTVTDRELVLALRRDEPLAWGEFATRASHILAATATRLRFSDEERAACGEELLARLAAHLGDPTSAMPEHLPGYIAQAAVRCRRETIRNRARSASLRYRAALADGTIDLPEAGHVIASLLSEHTRRVSRGEPDVSPPDGPTLATIIAGQLLHEMREVDVQLIAWHAASVPHRSIGEWLGLSAAAVAKRVQRVQRRARSRVRQLVALLPPREQDAWRRQWRPERRAASPDASADEPASDEHRP